MGLYRLLLRAYPASFRAEYGDELCALFARRNQQTPPLLRPALWLEALADVLVNGAGVHFDILRQDLRYTVRALSGTPGFTLTAIIVAALGIGATTAAFSVVDHVLIRPLPFADPGHLVKLWQDRPSIGSRFFDLSPAIYRDWKEMSHSFASMAAYQNTSVNIVGATIPRTVDGAAVTAEMFPTLGVRPLLGRAFTAEDSRDSAPGAAVLSYALWQSAFGGDAAAVGRKLILDGAPYTVAGVMPKDFSFPNRDAQLWTLLRFAPDAFADLNDTYLYAVARLKPGVTIDRARSEMNLIAAQLARAYPKDLARSGATILPMHDEVSIQSLLMLKALMGAALCVLLIACTNLANLLMARAMVRRKELAVRSAMGAGRERLVRQMLTESLVLALAGGVLGVLIAHSVLPLFVRLAPVYLPIAAAPAIDLRVLLFALLITCATGIGFGVVPAFRVFRGDDASGPREGSRSGVGGRRERLRSALVVAEIAGSLVLLISCGLLIRALWRIQAVDPGFRTANILTLRTLLPMPKYQERQVREAFYKRVLTETRQLPGVKAAAYISFLPMIQGGGIWPVEIQGHPQDLANRRTASLRFVTPGYFSLMGVPQLLGRDVSESDTMDNPFVAVVSSSFAERSWPGENPLGRHFNFGNYDRAVVGVTGDVRVRGLERASEPQVYLPYKQHDRVAMYYAPKDLAIRVAGDPLAMAPAIRRTVHEADPEQPISGLQPLSDIVEAETGPRRVQVRVLGCFALIAFLLAAIGIHGLLAFAVSTRTLEIGVRVALGARSADIAGMVLRDGAMLAGAGIVAGVALAYVTGRMLQALLAGVAPGDWATFAAAVALSAVMTLGGSLLPTLRALRVDPATAIRAE